MRVDFPAPFSPTMERISFSRNSKLTLSSAFTPGNTFVMLRISRIAFAMAHFTACAGSLSNVLKGRRGALGEPRHHPVVDYCLVASYVSTFSAPTNTTPESVTEGTSSPLSAMTAYLAVS